MKTFYYRVKELSSSTSKLRGNYVAFASKHKLAPLPPRVVENIEKYIGEVAKKNGIEESLLVLVNQNGDIVSYNSDINELLIPFE